MIALYGLFVAALMPVPAKMTSGSGELPIAQNFSISVTGACDGRVKRGASRLVSQISQQTGMPIAPDAARPALTVTCTEAGKPVQSVDEDESYRLAVSADGAKLTAPNSLGALRGFATFLQLIAPGKSGFAVAATTIDDQPRFPWRGLHLDVSRHWMPMEVVLRELDGMWAVKLNVFHWHLSDNQGFRVESRRYPKLQQLGSDGLYYTQDQVRAVIAYARDRGIRVLPEFDIPGHTTALLAAYPELGSSRGPFQIGRTWGIFDPVLDPTRDSVYEFLDGLIGEMAGLFPDAYFHIGGDEVNGREWNTNPEIKAFKGAHHFTNNDQLQAYFNKRIQPLVTKAGKKMMGWDEILQPDLPKDIVIHSWRGAKSLKTAIGMGFQGLDSSGYYLDHMQTAGEHYSVEIPPGILGGEVCMWTEYVDAENLDSRIWPRTAAIAEHFWSPREVKDVSAMYARLGQVDRELDWLGLQQNRNYARMLERLAGGGPVAPVKALADIVSPVPLGGRARAGKYTQQTPLNRLVDTARPDPAAAREFAAEVDARNDEALRIRFALWKDNAQKLDPMIAQSRLLSEVAPLSRDLTALGTIGLTALDYLSKGQKAPAGWIGETEKNLAEMKKPRAEVRFAVIDSMLKLVNAAK